MLRLPRKITRIARSCLCHLRYKKNCTNVLARGLSRRNAITENINLIFVAEPETVDDSLVVWQQIPCRTCIAWWKKGESEKGSLHKVMWFIGQIRVATWRLPFAFTPIQEKERSELHVSFRCGQQISNFNSQVMRGHRKAGGNRVIMKMIMHGKMGTH